MRMIKKITLPIVIISVCGFLLSLQLGLTTFTDSIYLSSALSKYTANPDRSVGYIYALGAAFSLLVFIFAPKLLRKFGNTKITTILGILIPVSLVLIGLNPNILILLVSFLIMSLGASIVFTTDDIYISSYASENDTGFIRGIYFAIISLGFMFAPAIGGYIVTIHGLSYAYFAGAICTIPLSFLTWFTFKNYKDEKYEDVPILPTHKLKAASADLMPIFWSHFALQAFYAIMTIYVPIYFIESLGISYDKFGYILTIALATFVILPAPLGYLADKYFGEKEMITIGIFLMGLSLISIPILAKHPQSILVWGIVLLISRIGATMTESMSDVFFFKKIEHRHPSFVSFYRRTRPLAFLIIPTVSALLLSTRLIDISELLLISGILIMGAVVFPLKLIDTK